MIKIEAASLLVSLYFWQMACSCYSCSKMVLLFLFAMGMPAGMQIANQSKKVARAGTLVVFVATYIPLMAKYLSVVRDKYNCREGGAEFVC